MASLLDPDGLERKVILGAADFTEARVIEIGSGDGRLSFRYAPDSTFVVGIEPKVDDVAEAVQACPRPLRRRVHFMPADAVRLPFCDQSFDIAVLAWSL